MRLAPDDGERLVHFRDGGDIVTGIPMHRHFTWKNMWQCFETADEELYDPEFR